MMGTGCGKDPILEAADEAAATATAPEGSPPGQPPGEAKRANVGDPQPGTPGTPVPGTPGTPVPGTPGAPVPGSPGTPIPGDPGAPTPGRPDEPKPGIPEEPKPGAPGSPQPFTGPTAKISGTVEFSAYKTGKVRITAFDGDHSAHTATPPRVVGSAEAETPGAFTIELPQNAGKVYLEAVIDEDGDSRPGPQDPQGKADRYPVTVRESDISGVVIELTKRAPPPTGTKEDF